MSDTIARDRGGAHSLKLEWKMKIINNNMSPNIRQCSIVYRQNGYRSKDSLLTFFIF